MFPIAKQVIILVVLVLVLVIAGAYAYKTWRKANPKPSDVGMPYGAMYGQGMPQPPGNQ